MKGWREFWAAIRGGWSKRTAPLSGPLNLAVAALHETVDDRPYSPLSRLASSTCRALYQAAGLGVGDKPWALLVVTRGEPDEEVERLKIQHALHMHHFPLPMELLFYRDPALSVPFLLMPRICAPGTGGPEEEWEL